MLVTQILDLPPRESVEKLQDGADSNLQYLAEKFPGVIDPNIPTPHTDFLAGILASAGNITREQIREERLSKYQK